MLVRELIAQLTALNLPDARVVTPGFDESDLDDLATVEVLQVVFRDDHVPGHSGRHVVYRPGMIEPQQLAVMLNF